MFVLSAANMVHALEVTATIPVKAGTYAIAYDSGKGEIWVPIFVPFVNEMGMHVSTSNSVSAISDSNNVIQATVTVGDTPSGIAYDSGKSEIFITNWLNSSVSVISDSTNTVVATVPVGRGPEHLVYDSGKGEIFVINDNETISVISDSSLPSESSSPTTSTQKSPTALMSPTPTAPEFPTLIILPLFAVAALLSIVLIRKKTKK